MHAYVDSSVVLRWLLHEPGKIESIKQFDRIVSSELLRVECLRVLHRCRLTGRIDDEHLAASVSHFHEIISEFYIVSLSRSILNRATQPTPTVIGTLDAMHLVTAQMWHERKKVDLTMLSHDRQLLLAAQAVGLLTPKEAPAAR